MNATPPAIPSPRVIQKSLNASMLVYGAHPTAVETAPTSPLGQVAAAWSCASKGVAAVRSNISAANRDAISFIF